MKKIISIGLIAWALTSCVTQKKYDALNNRKARIEAENAECQEKLTTTEKELEELELAMADFEKKYNSLNDEHTQVSKVLKRTKDEYDHLEGLHDRLTDKYSELLKLSSLQSNQLNKDLAKREADIMRIESELRTKQEETNRLSDELASREARVKELEQVLAEQQKAVQDLKKHVNDALLGFNDGDIAVEIRNGKVYVSLAEQLLFKSGSKAVDSKGQDALKKLAVALKDKADLNILVEGHTDDVPMASGTSGMQDNWDLSVLRATSIVRILTNNGVDPTRISASGRGEYLPVDAEKTKEARKKNRRTEIILTPKLDELFRMLE